MPAQKKYSDNVEYTLCSNHMESENDWVELAIAALDQAGIPVHIQLKIAKIIGQWKDSKES